MRAHGIAVGALLLSLLGCAHAPPPDNLASLRELAETRLHTPLPPVEERIALPTGELDLASALRIAFSRNPELQGSLSEVGVAQAELAAASAFPNPVLGLAARLPDRPPSAANIEFDLLGNLLDLLLRPQRIASGKIALEETVLGASSALLTLAADVESAYLTAVADGAKVRALRKLQRQASQDSNDAARLRESGVVSASAVLRAEALVAQHQLEVLDAQQALETSRARLARLLGLGADDAARLKLPRKLPRLPAMPPVVVAPADRAMAQRPEISALQKLIERRVLAQKIALDWRWLPSLQGGLAGERTSEGALALGPRMEIGLPVFDHGDARIARISAELAIAQRQLAARLLDVQSEAQLAAGALVKRHAAAVLQQQTLAPLRRRVLEVAKNLRSLGAASAEDLGQARQEYLRATSARLDAVRDYWLAEAALRRALGGSLESTASAP